MTTSATLQWAGWRKALLTKMSERGAMRFLMLFLILAACNASSPAFRGSAAKRVTVEGSVFDVRVRGELAEAIRINPQYAPRLGPIEHRAARAMAQVSGCEVIHISGDQVMILGELNCDGVARPQRSVPYPFGLDCHAIDSWSSPGQGRDYVEFDCAPI